MSLKRQGSRGKTILVETFSDLLPEKIRLRPKMGFGCRWTPGSATNCGRCLKMCCLTPWPSHADISVPRRSGNWLTNI
ncbi:MAG: hypothetical protein Ct9H300mP1_37700 [Planctomycetaceae bacterium]|nr:MAG: hypothetical protein Ct9H300mP1_37700 [Planctomycetaceae bacterium]